MDRVGGGQGHGALYEVGTLEIHARSRTVLVSPLDDKLLYLLGKSQLAHGPHSGHEPVQRHLTTSELGNIPAWPLELEFKVYAGLPRRC